MLVLPPMDHDVEMIGYKCTYLSHDDHAENANVAGVVDEQALPEGRHGGHELHHQRCRRQHRVTGVEDVGHGGGQSPRVL